METSDRSCSAKVLAHWVLDARARSLDLIDDLDDAQLMVPRLPTVNPMLWEVAHATWFQELWVLQHACGRKPILDKSGGLFDSIAIPHKARWQLPVPPREEILNYVCQVRDEVLAVLDHRDLSESLIYSAKLSVFHEDMHTEALTYTRQAVGYPEPVLSNVLPQSPSSKPFQPGEDGSGCDCEFDGGTFEIGAPSDSTFSFDNERRSHPVEVKPFAMARWAVTQSEFATFVDECGYRRREFWSQEGWQWREKHHVEHPVYWKGHDDGQWLCRHFAGWKPLDPRAAMIHVNWFEANAFCRWAGRRLPTEAEWEWAAGNGSQKRHYPWGETPPTTSTAHFDWQGLGPADVAGHAAGDSFSGCRQMLGNVWEWTASTFEPYPGFTPGPYKEYSRPCFGNCKVLRGGCWATRSRMIRNTWRNYYRPDRRDVMAGFRTCRVEP